MEPAIRKSRCAPSHSDRRRRSGQAGRLCYHRERRLLGRRGGVLRSGHCLLDQIIGIIDGFLLLVVEAGIAGHLLQGIRGFGVVAITKVEGHAVIQIALYLRIGGRQGRTQIGNAFLHGFGGLGIAGILVAANAAKNKRRD